MATRLINLLTYLPFVPAVIGRTGAYPPGWNGLAKTPPLGWRSWNAFGNRITQNMMLDAANALVAKNRTLPGDDEAFSLADIGYASVGVDEGWEGCGAGVNHTQHNASGLPTIDTAAFPSMPKMVAQVHGLGLSAGWYLNGCKCGEKTGLAKNYAGDIQSLHSYDFDGVKIDGCGAQRNMTLYAELMAKSGKSYTIENCHWGRCTDSDDSSCPTETWCPFNWYRTSGDINAGTASWLTNLQTTRRFQDPAKPLSQPGCWAYPDMLEVGRVTEPAPGTFYAWNRAHFGAWSVVSAPLILGLRLGDADLAPILDVIANREAIAVNQAWAGHPGGLVDTIYLPPQPYTPGGVTVPSSSEADFTLSGGAIINVDHPDAATSGGSAIRSGGPGQTSLVEIGTGVIGNGHRLSAISLQFRYTAGYTPAKGQTKLAPTVSVQLLDVKSKALVATLLTTPPLGEYSFDAFTGHSPPISLEVKGLEVPNDAPLVLALKITNNDRNLQIPIDDLASGFAIKVAWEDTPAGAAAAASAPPAWSQPADWHAAVATTPAPGSASVAWAKSSAEAQAEGNAGLRIGLGSVGASAGVPGAGQLWSKKMPGGGAAVLLINHSPANMSYSLNVSRLNMSRSIWGGYSVRDIWARRDQPNVSTTLDLNVPPFDSAFLRLSPLA